MKLFGNRKIRRVFFGMIWFLAACGSIVLLIAAVKKTDASVCKGINVKIDGVSTHYFVDKNDIEQVVAMYRGGHISKPIAHFDLNRMEKALKDKIWIRSAEIYFDNNGILQVEIDEREPVARIFTRGGSSFYIDSTLMVLPLSEKLSARLPVFTGFPAEGSLLNKKDSVLLQQVKRISISIQADPFLNSMIDQVDITLQRQFEMVPKIGNQLILFGDASDVAGKFSKLKLFYKNIIQKAGWSRYSVINLQYKNQVIGKIRGADDVSADSLRTKQLMQLIAENTERLAADTTRSFVADNEKNTTDSSMIVQSIQRDESQEPTRAYNSAINASENIAEGAVKAMPVVKSEGNLLVSNKAGNTKASLPKPMNKPKVIKIKPVSKKIPVAPKEEKNNDY